MYATALRTAAIGALFAFTGTAFAAISGTNHDFSGDTWSGGDLCTVCHTPHNGDITSITDAPLWNHDVSASTFTTYTSSSFDGGTTIGQPNGASLGCLSCHDGTVAIDSYGGRTGTSLMSGSTLLDIDLSNDHPIAFDYTTALATTDGELFDPSTTASGLTTSGTIDSDMLFTNQMQCASCHDVHDDTYGKFLIMDNTGSALCLTCHNK